LRKRRIKLIEFSIMTKSGKVGLHWTNWDKATSKYKEMEQIIGWNESCNWCKNKIQWRDTERGDCGFINYKTLWHRFMPVLRFRYKVHGSGWIYVEKLNDLLKIVEDEMNEVIDRAIHDKNDPRLIIESVAVSEFELERMPDFDGF
jgi:hypothetical protein